MALLPRPIIFPLILFIITSSFWLSRATDDCGGNHIAITITVNQQGGNETFTTIQAAIDSIKPQNDQWVKIRIHAGTYT